MLKIILSVIFILICVALTVLGKNKGRSMEGNLQKFTTFAAVAFMVLAIVLNLL